MHIHDQHYYSIRDRWKKYSYMLVTYKIGDEPKKWY